MSSRRASKKRVSKNLDKDQLTINTVKPKIVTTKESPAKTVQEVLGKRKRESELLPQE